jgi:hypothetical protein
VIDSFVLAPPAEGFDLDGDGTVDNALGSLRLLLNPILTSAYESSPRPIVLQTADVLGPYDPDVTLSVLVPSARPQAMNIQHIPTNSSVRESNAP